MGTDPHTHSSMHALVVLALGLACANALVPYAYNGYAGHAFPGYAYPGYAGHAYAGYGYPAYAHAAVAAPVEVEEKAVEVAPLSYTHHAAPYAYAAPAYAPYAAPAYAHPAAPAYAPTYASQYHSQDEYGQASYGYAQPGQAKSEVRDHFGNVAGSYYYINPEGKRVEVSYTAGVDGFKVHSNDLPVAPVHNVELPVAPVDTGVAPEPVQDTPEVAAAKAAHLELLAAADAEHAGDRKKRDTTVVAARYGVPHHGFGYSFGYPAYGYSHLGYAAPYARYGYHGYAAAPYAHHAAPVAVAPLAHHAATYAAPAVAHREATLTRVILNPGHAESYRVD